MLYYKVLFHYCAVLATVNNNKYSKEECNSAQWFFLWFSLGLGIT